MGSPARARAPPRSRARRGADAERTRASPHEQHCRGGGAAAQCVEVPVIIMDYGRVSNGTPKAALTPKHFRISVWRLSHRLRVVTACERLPSYDFFAKERICSTKPSFFARRSWRRSPDCRAPRPAQPRCSGFSSNTPPGTSYAACAAWASRPTRRGCAWTAFARRCVDPPPKSRNAPRRRKHTAERRTPRARPETSVYFLSRPFCGRAASARATARPSFSPRAPRVDPPTALVRRD